MDFKSNLSQHKNKDAVITLRVTQELKDELKQYARNKEMTVTNLVLLSLQNYIHENDKEDRRGKNILNLILRLFK